MIACDEFFVTLTDGFQQTMVLMLDVASRLTVTYPIRRATLNITSEEFQEALERAWLPWAGPPRRLRVDPAKAHLARGTEEFCRRHGTTPDVTSAENHDANAIVERRISAWKEVFVFTCREMVLTEADPVWSWSSHIDQALNTHLRVSGYSPYHFV